MNRTTISWSHVVAPWTGVPNRRKRATRGQRTTDLHPLMVDPGLPEDLNRETRAKITPPPSCTTRSVREKTSVLTETLLLTAVNVARPIRRK